MTLLFCPALVHVWLLFPLIARNVIKTIKNSISKEWLEKAIPQTKSQATQHSLEISPKSELGIEMIHR